MDSWCSTRPDDQSTEDSDHERFRTRKCARNKEWLRLLGSNRVSFEAPNEPSPPALTTSCRSQLSHQTASSHLQGPLSWKLRIVSCKDDPHATTKLRIARAPTPARLQKSKSKFFQRHQVTCMFGTLPSSRVRV